VGLHLSAQFYGDYTREEPLECVAARISPETVP
jgi:hypothetical protein